MIVVDHNNTMVLLIGASDFPEDPTITSIPNVKANIENFKKTLINQDIIGVPESNITISLNEDKGKIGRKLLDLVEKTRNKKYTILIYYSGHGILSSKDHELYLTTHQTSKRYLEIDGINIGEFKKSIKGSFAGRKIVILDCCHSGAIIGAMNDLSSSIQAEIKKFEGTYVMTSAAEDTPSLFPVDNAKIPTYFTGKLLEVINEGIEGDSEFCSLREIYYKIEKDFKLLGLPQPQQSNFNSADQLYFSRNKKFIQSKLPDELAWENAIKINNKWKYREFKQQFPQSIFAKEAKRKIYDIEEDESWSRAVSRDSIFTLDDYLENYPSGKYVDVANKRLNKLREKEVGDSPVVPNDESKYLNTKGRYQKIIWGLILILGIFLFYFTWIYYVANQDKANEGIIVNQDITRKETIANKQPAIDFESYLINKADSLYDQKLYETAAYIYLKYPDRLDSLNYNRLGFMYEKGLGVTRNSKEAKKWYKKAADLGDKDAKAALDRLRR